MELHSAYAKHEQRVVVVFTDALAAGAFGVGAPLFAIENLDGHSVNPTLNAALIVSGDTNAVELALATPMATGALFRVTVTAVPAFAGGTASGVVDYVYAVAPPKVNLETAASTAEEILLYGSDIVWNGVDFQETATGDLESVDGVATVTKALYRRCASGPLPWDPNYGARARDFVDSPSTSSGTLAGALAGQCMRDPRISKVSVRASVDNDQTSFDITPTLASGAVAEPLSIKVQNG